MARPRKLTPIEEQAIYSMKLSGISVTEIAFKNSISVRTVERIVRRIENEKQAKKS